MVLCKQNLVNKPIFISNLWPVSRLFPPPVCWQLVCLSRVSQLCIKLPSVLMQTRAPKVSGLLRRKGSQTPKEVCLPAHQIHAKLSHIYLFSWLTSCLSGHLFIWATRPWPKTQTLPLLLWDTETPRQPRKHLWQTFR